MKFLWVLALIFGFTVVANAQTTEKGILSRTVYESPNGKNISKLCGTIFDPERAPIPGVIIIAKSNNKGIFKTTSDEEGNFEIEIPDGVYKIIIKTYGFKKVVMKKQLLPYEPQSCRNHILKAVGKIHLIH